jgi:transposase
MDAIQRKEVPFAEAFHLFVGLDWAKDHHDAVAVDPAGQVVGQWRFPDHAEGWADFRHNLRERGGADLAKVAVAIETSQGPTVGRLMELGVAVYPLNPKSAERYRDRKAPAGVKDDALDAWSLGDALRTDGHGWRRLMPEDPLTQELRLLCRDEVGLIEQRTALVNQLQEALHEYYPAALEAFDDWTAEGAWEFVAHFPTPQRLAQAGRRRWEKFLHAHRLYHPKTYAKRLEIFARADQFAAGPGVTSAKSRLATAILAQLRTLEAQLRQYRKAIEDLFARHPDRDLFGSLPGVGPKLGPRLASEVGSDRSRFQSPQSLQCMAGTAPVTRQSGQSRWVRFRLACNKHLRAAVHLWAGLSTEKCAWADTYYRRKREQGMTHDSALRCLGQRWLKILWKMWQTRTPYNEALHTQNQVQHGPWKLTLGSIGARC